MNDDLGFIAGCVLVGMLCTWAVWSLALQFRQGIQSGTAVDRTLSEVDKDDAPAMFSLQMVGILLLIGASAMIGIGALVALVPRVVSG